jgi:hypothetical protein
MINNKYDNLPKEEGGRIHNEERGDHQVYRERETIGSGESICEVATIVKGCCATSEREK